MVAIQKLQFVENFVEIWPPKKEKKKQLITKKRNCGYMCVNLIKPNQKTNLI